MLQFKEITKTFNADLLTQPFVAVDNLSFNVELGKVTGFLGANGAGKTTTLKMLMDFIRPNSGEIIYPKELGNNRSEFLHNIGFLPERPYFYPHLKGKDFCHYMGRLSGLSHTEINNRINEWAPIFKIDFALDREIKTYSKGMLQRVGFLVTLLHDPKLIVLDEPLSGLDPIGRKELKDVIRKVNELGKTVFFSSHIISDVEEVCSDVVFIKKGSLFYQGSVENIISENKSDHISITVKKDNKYQSISVNKASLNPKLNELIQNGFEICSVNEDKPSLEEIIYNVK